MKRHTPTKLPSLWIRPATLAALSRMNIDSTEHDILVSKEWGPNEVPLDIWEKELMTALEALEEHVPSDIQDTIIWLLEDNTTTTHEICEVPTLHKRLGIIESLRIRNNVVIPIQTPSLDEPADEPSRLAGKEAPDFAPRSERAMKLLNTHRSIFDRVMKEAVHNAPKRMRMEHKLGVRI